MAANYRATLGLSERGSRLQKGSAPSSCRTPNTSSQVSFSSCSNNKQRARAAIAQGSHGAGRSTSARAASPAAAAAAVLRKSHRPASTSFVQDSYDHEEAAAAHMHALPGSRVELDESLEEREQPLYGGTFDGTHYDSQNWEEMTSLLSFDGKEHKYVMRHMPGAGMRVEDMFASFDGDDFEAVMTAAVRSSEPPAAAAAAAKPAPVCSGNNSSLDSSDEPEDLYLAVSRRRAAAMAAEAATKQSPKPRRRKAPLGSQASDAWMFQVPVNSQAAVQMQSLSLEQQYEAAQRALLPPLELAAAAEAARQQAAGVGAAGAVVAAASVAPQQQQQQQQEVVVVVVQRPDAGDRPVTPAPHAAHAQPAGEPHQLLSAKNSSGSSSNRVSAAGLLSEAAAVAQARPAAAAPEGMLGIAGVGAAKVATQQRQPGGVRNISSRVLSAAPALLAPLVAATAEMAGAAPTGVPAGGMNAAEAAAEEAQARARLPALPSSDGEEYERVMLGATVVDGSSSSQTGESGRAASASEAGPVTGDVYNGGFEVGGFDYVMVRQPAGRAALRRALS